MVSLSIQKKELLEFEKGFEDYNTENQIVYDLIYENTEIFFIVQKTQQKICKIKIGFLTTEDYEDTMLICKRASGNKKVIIATLKSNDPKKLKDIKKHCRLRNKANSYSDPLSMDFSNQARPSMFDSTVADQVSLKGFLNLCMIAMFAQNFSLIIHYKYSGFRQDLQLQGKFSSRESYFAKKS